MSLLPLHIITRKWQEHRTLFKYTKGPKSSWYVCGKTVNDRPQAMSYHKNLYLLTCYTGSTSTQLPLFQEAYCPHLQWLAVQEEPCQKMGVYCIGNNDWGGKPVAAVVLYAEQSFLWWVTSGIHWAIQLIYWVQRERTTAIHLSWTTR